MSEHYCSRKISSADDGATTVTAALPGLVVVDNLFTLLTCLSEDNVYLLLIPYTLLPSFLRYSFFHALVS